MTLPAVLEAAVAVGVISTDTEAALTSMTPDAEGFGEDGEAYAGAANLAGPFDGDLTPFEEFFTGVLFTGSRNACTSPTEARDSSNMRWWRSAIPLDFVGAGIESGSNSVPLGVFFELQQPIKTKLLYSFACASQHTLMWSGVVEMDRTTFKKTTKAMVAWYNCERYFSFSDNGHDF